MVQGTMEKLEGILNDMVSKSNGGFESCVITNERGLVVAGFSIDEYSTEALAAMISLLADTATRVNRNLKLDAPHTIAVGANGVNITTHEFVVKSKRFRIGAVLKRNGTATRSFLRRKRTPEVALSMAAERIRITLEKR